MDKNVKMLKAEQVEGHRGNLDLDVLVKYIEANDSNSSNSPAVNSGASSKGTGSQHAHNKMPNNSNNNNNINHLSSSSGSAGAKREIMTPSLDSSKKTKRVKTKSETGGSKNTLKKCNSLEEISKTKLDDLVAHKMSKNSHRYMKKQSTSEDGDGLEKESIESSKAASSTASSLAPALVTAPHKEKRERRSWGSEDSAQFLRSSGAASSSQLSYEFDAATAINVLTAETAEFHVVTKKKKSKKRNPAPATRQQILDEFHGKSVNHGPSYHYHRIDQSANAPQGHSHGEKARGDRMHNHMHHTSNSSSNSSTTGGRSTNGAVVMLSARRKSSCSVPHSDKSGDSSDTDSVHSLPAASTHRSSHHMGDRTEISDTSIEAAVSPNSTSYADIAKNTSNGVIPGVNCGASPPLVPVVATQTVPIPPASALRSDQFPELGSEPTPPVVQTQVNTQTYQQQRDAFPSLKAVNGPLAPPQKKPPPKVSKSAVTEVACEPVENNCVAPKARARSRAPLAPVRPAVIILNEAPPPDLHLNNSEPIQVSGLTFGFEVNEQLLNNCNSSSSGDETVIEEEASLVEDPTAIMPAKTAGELFIAKFVAPPVPDVKDCYNHDRIVTFVGLGEFLFITFFLGTGFVFLQQ